MKILLRLATLSRVLTVGLLLACFGWAQEAEVNGRVTDHTGGVVPGVDITITNTKTGAVRSAQTNNLGYYTLPLLQPGNYKMEAVKNGFRPQERTGIVLQVDQHASLDFSLEVGTLTQTVSVADVAPLLNSAEPSVGQVIENRQVLEMPLNGRNYVTLGLLAEGTADPIANSRAQGFSSGGQRVSLNNYLLDGADNNSYEIANAGRMGGMVAPSIDAIQEFKVQTNSYSAEYGRGTGAVINATIKSGTNELHGTAYEFLRNNAVDARNFFASPTASKPQYQRNQYGTAVGGPIVKNKSFIFGSWEATGIRQAQSAVTSIPTIAERGGNFSVVKKALSNPLSPGTVFPGNIIPASLIDPLGAKLINLYPAPQNSALSSNYLYGGPSDEDDRRVDTRFDHYFRAKDNIFVRLSNFGVNIPGALNLPPPAFGANGFSQKINGWAGALGWNHIFSSSLLAITRLSWTYNQFARNNPAVAGTENLNAKYGVPGGDTTVPGGFSSFAITGYTQLGIGANNPTIRDSQTRQFMSDLNWSHGAHNLKFGVNLMRIQGNGNVANQAVGVWAFNGQFTGDGMADFLLGWSSSFSGSNPLLYNIRGWLPAAYVQDNWRVSKNLTINLGMRYEMGLPYYDTRDRWANMVLDSGPPHLELAGSKGGYSARALTNPDLNGWEPRVGLAYQLNSKTVLRTGFGIYRTHLEPMAYTLSFNPPYQIATTITASQTAPAAVLSVGPPADTVSLAHANGLTFVSYPTNPHETYAPQWNFNIQRQFGSNWMFEAGYLGVKAIHLVQYYESNFAPPKPGNINSNRPIQSLTIPPSNALVSPVGSVIGFHFNGNSNYQALVMKMEKPLTKGLTLLGSYTWSKTMGDTCSAAGDGNATSCGFQNPLNLAAEKSLDNQHMGHRFVTSVLYNLPFGRGQRFGSGMPRAIDLLAGGWELGGIFTWHTGLPYSIVVSGNPANTGSTGIVSRPNLVGDPSSSPWSVDQAFNPAAFARQPLYTYGNLGRNTMTLHPTTNLDLVLSKVFKLTERIRLQARFEAFNSSNTPPFTTAPSNSVGTNGFGRITVAGAPRQLQFGLKAIF